MCAWSVWSLQVQLLRSSNGEENLPWSGTTYDLSSDVSGHEATQFRLM
jgi:hypothetical protein